MVLISLQKLSRRCWIYNLLLFYYCQPLKLLGKFVKNGLRDPHPCEEKNSIECLYLGNTTFCKQGGRYTGGYPRTLWALLHKKKEIILHFWFFVMLIVLTAGKYVPCGRGWFPLGLVKIVLLITHCKYSRTSSFTLHLLCHPHLGMGCSNAPGESCWTFKICLSSTYDDELRLRASKLLPSMLVLKDLWRTICSKAFEGSCVCLL